MSKVIIRVDPKTGQNYLPRHIREEGFTGEVEVLVNAFTVTFIKPGTNLADVDRSLQLVRKDIALRTQHERNVNAKMKNRGQSKKLPMKTKSSPTPRHPLFRKFSRAWLHEVTGYSKGYLCRVATGKIPLSRSFIERLCFKLNEPEEELFLAEALTDEARAT